jgi:hypothetical protein
MDHVVSDILLFSFLVICVGSLTKIILAFINRKSVQARLPAEFMERMERIEQIVETTAVEVERVSEAQRFTARVLAERGAGQAPPAGQVAGRVITPH